MAVIYWLRFNFVLDCLWRGDRTTVYCGIATSIIKWLMWCNWLDLKEQLLWLSGLLRKGRKAADQRTAEKRKKLGITKNMNKRSDCVNSWNLVYTLTWCWQAYVRTGWGVLPFTLPVDPSINSAQIKHLLRWFPHNIRAIMAKIKLPKSLVACYCFESS